MQLSPGLLTLVIAATSTLCSAQAFNIDHAGSPSTLPASDYGAAADQTGFWNAAGNALTNLVDVHGQPTGVQLASGGGGIDLAIDGATENDKLLMDSAMAVSTSSNATTFFNLRPGLYDVYVYCWAGNLLGPKDVTIRAFTGAGQVVGGVKYDEVWPGGHIRGITYDRLRVEVTPGDNEYLDIFIQAPGDFNVINGIQLVPVPAPGTVALLPAAPLACRRRRP
jgi:hypothetical protein